jgi:hypothetical protein
MIDSSLISGFYKNPFRTSKILLNEKDLKWIYPLLLYLISFSIAFLLVLILKLNNPKVVDFWKNISYAPFLTFPFIFIFTLTGTIFFKEFHKNLLAHLYCTILIVSYNFLILILLIVIAIGFYYSGRFISPKTVAIIYLFAILISRITFNLKIYKCRKNMIWIKSIVESLLTLILIVIFFSGFSKIMSLL